MSFLKINFYYSSKIKNDDDKHFFEIIFYKFHFNTLNINYSYYYKSLMTTSQNKDIELYDIIYSLINIVVIFISSIISLTLGYIYISKISNEQYNYILKINHVSNNEIQNYAYFNKFELIEISSDLLMDEFIREFTSKKALEIAFSEINYFEKNSNTDEEIDNLINNIYIKDHNTENFIDPYEIEYTGKFNNKFSEGIHLALKYIQNNIRENLKTYIDNQLNIQNFSKEYEIDDAKLKIKNIKNDYEKQISRDMSYLKEQLQLARILEISGDGSAANTNMMGNYDYKKSQNDYLRGYLALEEEIKIIVNRNEEEKEAHMPDLKYAENNLRLLLQDKNIQRASEAYKLTPIYNNNLNFKAIEFDISKLKIKENITSNKYKLLLTFLILAMTLSSIFVVFYSYYRNTSLKN